MTLRHRVHVLLHNPSGTDPKAAWINRFLAALIVLNAAAVVMETVPSYFIGNERAFFVFEAFSTIVYLVEYVFRLWVAVEQPAFRDPLSGRLRWMMRPLPLMDAIVILTYFAPVDLRFLRLFRLLRLFRVFHLPNLALTYEKLRHCVAMRRDLLIVSGILMSIAVLSSASLLYIFEFQAQPKVFSSIPAAMWWSIVTLTTVGYGDIYPITVGGKICAAITAVLGIGVFALPAAILTGAVIEAGAHATASHGNCPHCGKALPHHDT